MKQYCEYCEDNTPAVYLMTVKDADGHTVATFDSVPVCEDHLEEVDASVQMVNLTKKTARYTFTKTRIQP